jgi:hypothetical protein
MFAYCGIVATHHALAYVDEFAHYVAENGLALPSRNSPSVRRRAFYIWLWLVLIAAITAVGFADGGW